MVFAALALSGPRRSVTSIARKGEIGNCERSRSPVFVLLRIWPSNATSVSEGSGARKATTATAFGAPPFGLAMVADGSCSSASVIWLNPVSSSDLRLKKTDGMVPLGSARRPSTVIRLIVRNCFASSGWMEFDVESRAAMNDDALDGCGGKPGATTETRYVPRSTSISNRPRRPVSIDAGAVPTSTTRACSIGVPSGVWTNPLMAQTRKRGNDRKIHASFFASARASSVSRADCDRFKVSCFSGKSATRFPQRARASTANRRAYWRVRAGIEAANATDCRRFGCVQIFTIIRTTLMAQLNRAIAKRLVGDHLRSLKTMKIRSEATTAK